MTELKRIDSSNYLECLKLKLNKGQSRFVSPPARSLAAAYAYRDQCTPFGIYGGGAMVGYLMVIYDYDEKTYNIWHMMIDRAHQHRGYGRAALSLAIEYIEQLPFGKSDTILITCNPKNSAAWQLYNQFGFAETGREDGDERELFRSIPV